MLTFDILTLFPQLLEPHFGFLPFKKALALNSIHINTLDLRKFALDSYGTVDNKTYGGGVGMVLMVEPIYKALCTIAPPKLTAQGTIPTKGVFGSPQHKIIALSPAGKPFTQQAAQELSQVERITLICGRYEGLDQRVLSNIATDVYSIGDYVLSGGELPALVMMESICRILPGVLEKPLAALEESFTEGKSIEYPQYTRPEDFMGLKVPEVLLSGNHKEIEKWRKDFFGRMRQPEDFP